MKNVLKKIIPLICVIAISISCVVPVFAVDTSTKKTFWDFIVDYGTGKFAIDNLVDWWKNLTGKDSYDSYTADMQTQLGTDVIEESGSWRVYLRGHIYPTFDSAAPSSDYSESPTLSYVRPDCNSRSYSVSWNSETYTDPPTDFKAPYAGVYTLHLDSVFTHVSSYALTKSDGTSGTSSGYVSVTSPYFISHISGDPVSCVAGESLLYYKATPFVTDSGEENYNTGASFRQYWSVSDITGVTVDSSSDTRIGSLCGNYTYTGDNGTQIVAEKVYLMDETNHKVNNPATGESYNVTDWNYDYSTRTYNYTTDNSTYKSGTVSYGDDNACVKLTDSSGNTITYNYNYGGTSTGTGGGSGTGTDTDKPSTGIGGLIEGLLSTVGDAVKGVISGILKLLTKAVEALGGVGDLFKAFGEKIVGIFGGFTSFLAGVFPFLPEEFFTILNLGLILLIAAAVIRLILKGR